MKKSFISFVALTALWLSSATAQITETKLTASDGKGGGPANGDWFGFSVSISGDYVIVGAHRHDPIDRDEGSAYIFKRDGDTWIEHRQLTASDPGRFDWFGHSVSVQGDYAIVGSPMLDNIKRNGAGYVFKREGENWIEAAKITAGDGDPASRFGWSVSIDGEYAIVGAFADSTNGDATGSAYVFKRDGTIWMEQAKLTASDGVGGDLFGAVVSISGDNAIVGTETGSGQGNKAYIFKRDGITWVEQTQLRPEDLAIRDNFGSSVCIAGDYAIVGANLNDDNGSGSGSAYIFKRQGDSWVEQVKLTASDAEAGHLFGSSVSIAGDSAIVGAVSDDQRAPGAGAAYIFKRNGESWTEQVKLGATDAARLDNFGSAVSITSDQVIVGAHLDNDTYKGKAYVFTGLSTVVSIEEDISRIPTNFTLEQNYPNPFNPTTVISYQLSEFSDVELTIYNQLGQELRTLVKERKPAGTFQIEWDGRDHAERRLASAVYLYRLKAGSFVQTRKMVLLR